MSCTYLCIILCAEVTLRSCHTSMSKGESLEGIRVCVSVSFQILQFAQCSENLVAAFESFMKLLKTVCSDICRLVESFESYMSDFSVFFQKLYVSLWRSEQNAFKSFYETFESSVICPHTDTETHVHTDTFLGFTF